MNQLTELLAETKRICEAATPGPYFVQRFDNEDGSMNYQVETEVIQEEELVIAWCTEMSNLKKAKQNAAFIAHARDMLPRLVAALELAVRQTNEQIHFAESDSDTREEIFKHYQAELARVLKGES